MASRGEGTAGPNVLLAVSDTGVGMSDEVQRHLFEPFFTTKSPGAGTGLGLATVFGVVKQSGGSIYVYSEEGRGTTFKIYLPAAAGQLDAIAARRRRRRARQRDDHDRRGRRERARPRAHHARDQGLQRARGGRRRGGRARSAPTTVDLLLTDVVMPEVNGRALAERLSLTSPSMRILFMSGYSDEAVYRHGEISPNAAFIEKPFTDRTLARKVREVLDG